MNKIFGKLREKILSLLFLNESEEFYVREIASIINSSPMGALKELEKLEKEGIIVSRQKGRLRLFKVNKENPTHKELQGLIIKSFGVVDLLKDSLFEIKGIKEAFIYGSIAKGEFDYKSDIDLFIIGQVDYQELNKKVDDLQKNLRREINIDLMKVQEFQKKLKEKDPYIIDIQNNKKIYLIKDGKRV